MHPNPSHPDATAVFVMVVATPDERLTVEQLLRSIPDPIIPLGMSDPAFHQAMNKLQEKFKTELRCAAQFASIPAQ